MQRTILLLCKIHQQAEITHLVYKAKTFNMNENKNTLNEDMYTRFLFQFFVTIFGTGAWIM